MRCFCSEQARFAPWHDPERIPACRGFAAVYPLKLRTGRVHGGSQRHLGRNKRTCSILAQAKRRKDESDTISVLREGAMMDTAFSTRLPQLFARSNAAFYSSVSFPSFAFTFTKTSVKYLINR
jgi:hypothetical protein